MINEKISSDVKNLGYLYLAAIVVFKILFINETAQTTIIAVSALFWLFIIPGFFMTRVFGLNDFAERLVLGILLSGALVGISAYYLGIFGLHVKYSAIVLPPLFLALSIWLSFSRADASEHI